MKNLIYPAQGSLSFSWQKTAWFYCMLIPTLFIDFYAIPWSTLLFGALLTFITVCLGHSIGLHRGVIHKAYKTGKLTENILVFCFVLTGLGSPIDWMNLHYYRDYWQNREDCPPYFAYQHSILKDYWWYLHLSFETENNLPYKIPEKDSANPWFLWLHKTWYLHNLILMVVVLLVCDLNTMLFLMNFRIALIIIGHWYIGYAAHKYGYARFKIDKANESGYNDVILGLLSFGEGFHNNHHGHPSSAKFSQAWYEIDLSWYLIAIMEKMSILYDVQNPHKRYTQKATAIVHEKIKWRAPWKKKKVF